MKVSNKQKEQARNADLISFMQDNYPTSTALFKYQ